MNNKYYHMCKRINQRKQAQASDKLTWKNVLSALLIGLLFWFFDIDVLVALSFGLLFWLFDIFVCVVARF